MSERLTNKSQELLSLLNKIQPPKNISTKPDVNTEREEEDLDRAEKRAKIRSANQDIELREIYSSRIFIFMCLYLGIVVLILLGCSDSKCPIKLSDKVLITTLSTTTANVIGIFAIVARYLFPKK